MNFDRRIEAVIRADVRQTEAYLVQASAGLIKLDAMENPHPLPEPVARAWQARSAQLQWNRYPDGQASALRQLLREVFLIDERWGLILGNGSDELIQLLAMAIPDTASVLAPAPSFTMYRVIADAMQQRFVSIDLDQKFDLDLPAMMAAISAEEPAIIFLASPNNPTGNCFSEDRIRAVIAAAPGLVVVDEAYFAFTEVNAAALLDEFDNLLVMRTLSKLGLAGLRLGFLWGDRRWIAELDKLRLPYNISSLNQAAAETALEHFRFLQEQAEETCRQRVLELQELEAITGLTAYPSQANFILIRLKQKPSADVYRELKNRAILVKNLDGSHPALAGCLRVTVGSADENAELVAALKAIV